MKYVLIVLILISVLVVSGCTQNDDISTPPTMDMIITADTTISETTVDDETCVELSDLEEGEYYDNYDNLCE
ncbi:hypothetical protein CL614_01995 [archaeon]|nr:hypothetical protein [archaeon]|tara:strand:- start:1351 stop:1566 length:216 start_codon:yes stop_codon:yes gene_type:complete